MREPNLKVINSLAIMSEGTYSESESLYMPLSSFLQNSSEYMLNLIQQMRDLNYKPKILTFITEMIIYMETWMRDLKRQLPPIDGDNLEEMSLEAKAILEKNRVKVTTYPLVMHILYMRLEEMIKDPELEPVLRKKQEKDEERARMYYDIEDSQGVDAAFDWIYEELTSSPEESNLLYPKFPKELGPPITDEEWAAIFKKN
jgi:hypothetical protein